MALLILYIKVYLKWAMNEDLQHCRFSMVSFVVQLCIWISKMGHWPHLLGNFWTCRGNDGHHSVICLKRTPQCWGPPHIAYHPPSCTWACHLFLAHHEKKASIRWKGCHKCIWFMAFPLTSFLLALSGLGSWYCSFLWITRFLWQRDIGSFSHRLQVPDL